MSSIRLLLRCFAVLLAVLCLLHAAEPVFISEFVAANNGGLRDEDNVTSDWIEIFNSATTNVNLNGWYLTDDPDALTKWRFPATNIPPNGFLIVFASGKNKAIPGAPLHANFSLSANGEYLALVHSNGVTIASEFAPQFPEQFDNVSYGVAQDVQLTRLVASTAAERVLVPTNSALGTTWTATNFNDAAWLAATNGVGYETYVPGFAIRNVRANVGVCDLGTAESVLVTPSMQAATFTETRNVVNYMNTGGAGNFASDVTFPGLVINADADNFVLEATGVITIPTAGAWMFGVNSDDGFQVTIDGANTFSYPSPRGPGDTFGTFNLSAGDHAVRLIFYECNGGSEVEFFAAPGSVQAFTASSRLVGDTANGGLAVKSLPTGANGSVRPLIATDVQTNMSGRASSAYIRIPFNVTNPAVFSTLTLRMKYDDAFVAHLNGTEIARRNFSGTPQWNSVATTNRVSTNAVVFQDIDVTASLNLLRAGTNVLAIHGLTASTNASDFLVLAELVENKILGITNHYFATPSPGAPNGAGFNAFVENLKFTPGRGWFDSTNFSVTITSATPNTVVRYTTDGSAPSPSNGTIYNGGIPVNATTIIRAIGYRDGFEPTEVETHSYIFLNSVQRQSTNSGWVGGSSGNYSIDTNVTLGPQYGPTFKGDLTNIPTLSIAASWEDMWGANGVMSNPNASGVAFERACSVEYMRPDGKKGFNENCGIRIQGGVSRSAMPKHGLRLLFKNVYGEGKLDYDLFGSSVEKFDTLTLHASFNDHWLWGGNAAVMHRDQWCRDTQNAMGGFGPHGTYAQLFINGIYWGLYNIGEKGDASYAASYLGGDKADYDAMNSDELVDGDLNRWNAMFAVANAGITNDVAYTNLGRYLNIPNFIDYMLLNFYGANTDWPWHNWNAAGSRSNGLWHFFSWDAEWTFGIGNDVNTDRTGETAGSPGTLYTRLRAHPEFVVQFGDHAQKHLFNSGALTPAAAQARWDARATEINRAVIAELARWVPGTTRATWQSAESAVLGWFPQRTAILLNQLRNAGLYPQLNAPTFAPFGGLVPPGYTLAIAHSNAAGSIYFTTDGSDPRQWGGAVSPTAQAYASPLVLSNAVFLRARVRNGTSWSALVEAPFYVVQDFAKLKITEVMYNPPTIGAISGDEFEFIELKNTGTNTVDLSGLQFTDGITFNFTNGTRLAPGAFFVLARTNIITFKYPGLAVRGYYSGKLDNNGEKLTLAHVLGTNVFSFTYNNALPWPITPNGYGFSLVPANGNNPDVASSWRASANLGGSPGADDPVPSIAPVVINEILTHTDPPSLDAIELFNPTGTNVDVGGWFLSDDPLLPKKFRIPTNTVIAPYGFAVFDESQFNAQPGVPPSFALNSFGESLYLFSANASSNLTGYSHSFDYGAAANGVSFGRYVNSIGDEHWPATTSATFGSSNSAPIVEPVVINEIMYHPADGYDEFVELVNISSNAVALYDVTFPTNSWRMNGLGYTFSNDVVMSPGSYLLVVPMDPAAFRAKYSVPMAVQIVGPFAGELQNSGERLQLQRPDVPDTNGVAYIVVDDVRFNDQSPWPLAADGQGPSLQRRAPGVYGNEPTNWFASGITPGAVNAFNQSPDVTLTSPTNNAQFIAPALIPLSASASDADGAVMRVEYYEGAIKLGEATSPPWSVTWTNPAVGTHSIVARARDNGLAVTTSTNITITVNPPALGNGTGLRGEYFDNADFTGLVLRRIDSTVNFEWGDNAPDPAIGADTFSARWTGLVQARYSEAYTFYAVGDDGVRLWVNNQLLVDQWHDQGPTEWSGVISLQAGLLYDIRLEYYENGGGAVARLLWSSPSTAKDVIPSSQLYEPGSTNLAPLVSITNPVAGAVFVTTAPLNIIANAVDPDGVVTNVEFYANGVKIGQDVASPFALSWTNGVAGAIALTARAYDDYGVSRTSAPVNVTFIAGVATNVTLISTGSLWRYHDKGSDLSNVWSLIGYNDSGWSNGPAELGYGDSAEGRPEATQVGYGPDANNKFITTYFRRMFGVADRTSITALNMRVLRDDGVVVYLNGSEIFRNNMPGGAITYLTPASAGATGADEYAFYSSAIDPSYLLNGTNVIAAEVHQNAGNSTDLSFDFELTGVQTFIAPTFAVQPQSQTNFVSSNVTFTATLNGSGPMKYQWRLGGTNLPGATNLTLVRTNIQLGDAGDYTLAATNIAGGVLSSVAKLTVIAGDTDADGMPDWWESLFGLNPAQANDALLDSDGDGLRNVDEFRAGTNPTNALSTLRVVLTSMNPLRLSFIAQSNVGYNIQFNTNSGIPPWTVLSSVSAVSQVRTVVVTDPRPATNQIKLYRAVVK